MGAPRAQDLRGEIERVRRHRLVEATDDAFCENASCRAAPPAEP